jgi:AraC-like DNA-binding protein
MAQSPVGLVRQSGLPNQRDQCSPSILQIAALVSRPSVAAALRRSIAGFAQLQLNVYGIAGLLSLAGRDCIGAILVSLGDRLGKSRTSEILLLRAAFPEVPIVGVIQIDSTDLREIVPAVRAGVCELIVLGADDPLRTLRTAVRARRGRPPARVTELLHAVLPTESFSLVRECLTWATTCRDASDLAHKLGCSTRTLLRRCRAARLMSPAKLLTWARLMLAAHEIDRGDQPLERIAERLHFSSASDLRRAMRRSCDLRPCDIKGLGAVHVIVASFALACRRPAADLTRYSARPAGGAG